MKKIFFLLSLICVSLYCAETPVFKIVSDCKHDQGFYIVLHMSNWQKDLPEDDQIKNDGVRMSSQILSTGDPLGDTPKAMTKFTPLGRTHRKRLHGNLYLPITQANFPFRIVVTTLSENNIQGHSFLFSSKPNMPGTIYMSVEEANSPDTILHFACGKYPHEISDWNFVVETPKREMHKAAKKPITELESLRLKTPLTPEQIKKAQGALPAGMEFVKVPKEPGIPDIVADFLSGELTEDEKANFQKELEAEQKTKKSE